MRLNGLDKTNTLIATAYPSSGIPLASINSVNSRKGASIKDTKRTRYRKFTSVIHLAFETVPEPPPNPSLPPRQLIQETQQRFRIKQALLLANRVRFRRPPAQSFISTMQRKQAQDYSDLSCAIHMQRRHGPRDPSMIESSSSLRARLESSMLLHDVVVAVRGEI